MSSAKDIIPPRAGRVSRSAVSNSWSAQQLPAPLSTSPSLAFHSPPRPSMGAGASLAAAMAAQHPARSLTPFATADIKVLLLENVNATGQDLLRAQGYQVEALSTSLGEDELVKRIKSLPPFSALQC